MGESFLGEGQLGIADRVVGTLVGGFVVAEAIPAGTPDDLEFGITDFCFRQGGATMAMEWMFGDWLDEPAAEMLFEAISTGFIWSSGVPSPVHVFVGAALIGPALADIGHDGWKAMDRQSPGLVAVDMYPEHDDGSPPSPIVVSHTAHADQVFKARTNQFLDFAEVIAAGDWTECPDCGEPWDRDDYQCIDGCFRPEALEGIDY
jgi:hypothetical protein